MIKAKLLALFEKRVDNKNFSRYNILINPLLIKIKYK